jgi:hypothetical protein
MSFSKAICILSCAPALLLGCQERDGSGDASKPVETALKPSSAVVEAIDRRPLSEEASDRHSATPLPAGEGRYPHGPERRNPTLQLEPMDMMTAVGNSPLHVLVSKLGTADASDVLERVAAAVQLRTWPELDEVPTTTSQSVEGPGAGDQAGYGHVYLQPSTPLTDRWYALVLESVPSGVDLPAFASVHTTDSGKHVARFRVGSEPVVTGLRVYAKEAQKQVVYVDFSERVVGDAQGVVVTGPSGKCQGVRAPAAPKPSGFPTKSNGAGEVVPTEAEVSTNSLQLVCSGRIDPASELTLEVKSGFRSASGPALNAGKGVRVKAAATDWKEWGEGGRQLRLALP